VRLCGPPTRLYSRQFSDRKLVSDETIRAFWVIYEAAVDVQLDLCLIAMRLQGGPVGRLHLMLVVLATQQDWPLRTAQQMYVCVA
jgi:hypothetical protein